MAHPVGVGEQSPQGARVEAAPTHGQEERVLGASRQVGTCLVQVSGQPVRGLLSQRNQALFAALAAYVHQLLLEVDVPEIKVDSLAATEPGRVDELAEGSVAEAERTVALQPRELRVDLFRLR